MPRPTPIVRKPAAPDPDRKKLWRIELYCTYEWSLALLRVDDREISPDAPFEVRPWLYAQRILSALRRGQPVADQFTRKGING